MGITMDKNQASIAQTLASNKTTDLIGDVSMFQRRIEFLEEQAQERNRLARLEQEPYKKEIERLNEELMTERSCRANLIKKKNAEIAYFKSELDALLGEITTQASSGAKSQKTNSPQHSDRAVMDL